MKLSQIVIVLILFSYIFFFYKKKFVILKNPVIALNYKLISIIITMAVLSIFSFNSSILKSYNENYIADDLKKRTLSYDFLNPSDIIKLPFDQLKLWFNKHSQDTINLNPQIISQNGSANILIIIDKTGSTICSEKNKRIFEKIYHEIKDEIQ